MYLNQAPLKVLVPLMLGTHLEAMVELSEIEEDKSAAREMSLKSILCTKIYSIINI
jgi:hypothetical protein